jgi:hypothetical protein
LERKRLGIDFREQMGYSSVFTMPPQEHEAERLGPD